MTRPSSALTTAGILFVFVILSASALATDRGHGELRNSKEQSGTTKENIPFPCDSIYGCTEESLTRKFGLLDIDGNDRLELKEFRQGLIAHYRREKKTLGFEGIRRMFDEIDGDDSGYLDLKEFLNTYMSDHGALMISFLGTTNEKIQFLCHLEESCTLYGLTRLFRFMDRDKSSSVTLEEFFFGISLEFPKARYIKAMTKDIFERIDQDGNKSLSIHEFFHAFRPSMSQARYDMIKQAFDKLDTNGDGSITVEDLEGVYDATKHPKYIAGELTEAQVLQSFIDSFQLEDKDEKVSWEEFLSYWSVRTDWIRDDAYFKYRIENGF